MKLFNNLYNIVLEQMTTPWDDDEVNDLFRVMTRNLSGLLQKCLVGIYMKFSKAIIESVIK